MTVVYPREVDTIDRLNRYLELFTVNAGRIADTPHDAWSSWTGDVWLRAKTFHVADLDLDGDDELIVVAPVSQRNGAYLSNGEIWIYEGGPGFQVDSPTVVIRDAEHHGDEYTLCIGDIDGDRYPDLVCVTFTGGRIRWGGPEIRSLDRPVDRMFSIAHARLDLLDVDGDGTSDLLWKDGYLHVSSSGKNARLRGFDQADADRHYVARGESTFNAGPLNDSADRYSMIGINSALGDNVDLFFSRAHGSPDARYEGIYSTQADGLGQGYARQVSTPLGDVDGNGWRDFLCGSDRFNDPRGIAVVIGGGPHIPRDSMPASAIRDITVDGRHAAISVWPNPATDNVHIAWRGDFSRTPATFTVHDALGRLVARGDAEGARGEVVWRCAERPTGMYMISIYDRHRGVLAAVALAKR